MISGSHLQLYLPVMKILPSDELFSQLNQLGEEGNPCVFIIDSVAEKGIIIENCNYNDILLWRIPNGTNFTCNEMNLALKVWNHIPVPIKDYKDGFDKIQKHIRSGETYLLNYTQPAMIETNLNLEELFYLSRAKYKVLYKDHFVCFSPETFVKIEDRIISSYPMKGTIEYTGPHSENSIINDSKELAEHSTIVDLIRNDLSHVAENVRVNNFRFTEQIKTNRGDLIQVSSEIKGTLPDNWPAKLGTILSSLLPAGSVTGAPKKRTLEIIKKVENYDRGWYTGIFGVFDGKALDSAVLIRFIEENNGRLIFKSGGGITFMSDCEKEYTEMIKKIYVPVN